MTYGKSVLQSTSRKQKLNTWSSTEGELVGAKNMSVMILWTKLFMEAQGYEIKKNILYQDNKSTILLEQNRKLIILSINDIHIIKWYMDTAFVVHADF